MKYLFSLFLTLLCVVAHAKPIDTVDNWRVTYNGKVIARMNQTDIYLNKGKYTVDNTITLEKSKLKPGDYLAVWYDDDTPAADCKTGLYFLDKNKHKIIMSSGTGTRNALEVYVSSLLQKLKQLDINTTDIYYFDTNGRNQLVFTLRIR